jgi:hypothetical protein
MKEGLKLKNWKEDKKAGAEWATGEGRHTTRVLENRKSLKELYFAIFIVLQAPRNIGITFNQHKIA